MSRHSFDPEIAQNVGLNAAVIYQNIVWWIERNAVKGRNIKDGNVWTFNSVSEFAGLFPYLTEKQVRTALERLLETGLLETSSFNKDARDRTKWYALPKTSKAFAQMVQLHLPKRADTFAPEGEPLPVSKPVSKHTPIPPEGACDLFSENEQEPETHEAFDDFWKVYPKKAGKPAARKAWDKALKSANPSEIIEGAKRYAHWLANPKKGEFRPHPKHPQGWLSAGRWADEEIWQGFDAKPSWDTLSDSQRRMLERGQCPPSMVVDGKPSPVAVQLYETLAIAKTGRLSVAREFST